MAISEESRHQLYNRLEELLGREEATTVMEYLPPVGWADVATKRDLDHLAVATKRDLDHLAVATKRDLDQFAVATKRDLDHLAVSTKRDLEVLESRLEARISTEINRALATQTRTILVSNASMLAAVAGLAAVLAR